MLKEQDPLIELIREWIVHPEETVSSGCHLSVLEVFEIVERLINEHVTVSSALSGCAPPKSSGLQKYLPRIGPLFLSLPLVEAARQYDAKTHLLKRRFVPPTFKEVRHILNLAVIMSIPAHLKLITFDADDTIYEDGGSIRKSSPMAQIIVRLLQQNLVVSLVTAAGYPGNPGRYEQRLHGVLEALAESYFVTNSLSEHQMRRFLVMGGECNYLHRIKIFDTTTLGLEVVHPDVWKDGRGVRWSETEIVDLLDKAELTLRQTVETLELPAEFLRKERACGIINTSSKRFSYEILEEIALTVQQALQSCTAPHCAFNGGNDVWVDVGNKALGIAALQVRRIRECDRLFKPTDISETTYSLCIEIRDRPPLDRVRKGILDRDEWRELLACGRSIYCYGYVSSRGWQS